MQRTREEMIEAASRARAARSAKAKQQRKRGGVMVATRKQTGSGSSSGKASGGTATATKPRRQMVKANAAGKQSTLQPIQADCDYPLAVFLAFTGLTAATVRKCQRLGLRVRRRGNKRFISGEDWLAFNRQRDGDQGGDGDSPGDTEGGGQ
jgi:hypothetical protein